MNKMCPLGVGHGLCRVRVRAGLGQLEGMGEQHVLWRHLGLNSRPFGKPRGREGPAGCDSPHGSCVVPSCRQDSAVVAQLMPWGWWWLPGHTCATGRSRTLAGFMLWLSQARGFTYPLDGEGKLEQTRACCEMTIWTQAESNGGKYVSKAAWLEYLIARGNQGNQTLRVLKRQLR